MQTVRVASNKITLPPMVAERLKGKSIRIVETEAGFLIKTVHDPIKKARGILKKEEFSTEKYFEMKRMEKALEK